MGEFNWEQPSTLVGTDYIVGCAPFEESGNGSIGNSGL